VLDYFPGVVRGEGVNRGATHGAYLLQFLTDSFRAGWQVEMVLLFTVWHSVGRLSMDYESRMSQGLILIDAVYSVTG
jgi:hypothetical protein